MEYQETLNLLDNTTIKLCKFRTKICVEINDDSRGTFNINSQIKFKASMLKSGLCDYSDAYIDVKGTIVLPNIAALSAVANSVNKELILKNCTPFTNYTSKVNNA